MSGDHWKRRPEGGGLFALWLIRTVARRGGRTLARSLLWPITAYFLLMRGPERRASRAYLRRVLPVRPSLLHVARHIHTFASTILDRVFLLSGQLERFDFAVEGLPALEAQLERGQGAMILGSHLGSFDALRVLATRRPDLRVRVLLDKAHNPAMQQLLDALNPRLAADIIDAGQPGTAIVLAIREALEEGALVALLADRALPGDASARVAFLGEEARFPLAPWQIAGVLQVPVTLAFGLYRGGNRYEVVFEPVSDGLSLPRHERRQALGALVQTYAARLQHHARRAPYNWFNFYDFWQPDDASAARDESPEPGRDAARTRDGSADAARRAP
ncbi:LpxL/LpxP family acyltransferase [Lysobacter solisilvae (ex Woo and Kim 2020)]|uniref:Acyltransferase n=1 Tax=Agrilutibacter terrestris TaxID=2865112 RepID=A0A7H0FU30_9GAMM|nr:acyltransferase [Lysobacter terrestris]